MMLLAAFMEMETDVPQWKNGEVRYDRFKNGGKIY
jgi:hypothetical protein